MTQTQAVSSNIAKVPSDPTVDSRPWIADPFYSNSYKPCAPLSFVALTVMGATGGTVEPIMLFHNGKYIGRTTEKAYPLDTITQTSDSSIEVVYTDVNHNHHTTDFTYTGGNQPVKMTGEDPTKMPMS